ncbi:ROK family protein [Enterococcus sp.]|uniref:ROK family protein n=1 Tax=Enterococcus sp. TaxID=35783 RepID=UPI002FCBEDB6
MSKMTEQSLFVLDLGGSAVKYSVWYQEELYEKGKFNTPKTFTSFLEKVVGIKERLAKKYNLVGCACSLPGTVNVEEKIIEGTSAIKYIHQETFIESLESCLGLPIRLENDANCAALAEVSLGAAKGKKDVLVLVLGSGIGGAIIKHGRLEKGYHLVGGEFGYMLLNEEQNFSQLSSPVALAKRVSERKGYSCDKMTSREVFDLADKNDPIAFEEVEKMFHFLAIGLYNLQMSIDPEIILIGGAISKRSDLLQRINAKFETLFLGKKQIGIRPNIAICQFENDANLIGAVVNYHIG